MLFNSFFLLNCQIDAEIKSQGAVGQPDKDSQGADDPDPMLLTKEELETVRRSFHFTRTTFFLLFLQLTHDLFNDLHAKSHTSGNYWFCLY